MALDDSIPAASGVCEENKSGAWCAPSDWYDSQIECLTISSPDKNQTVKRFLIRNVFFLSISVFTDLCSSEHLPEVEIFSLLEEQIPKYKIRADTLTQFSGYENQVNNSIASHRHNLIWLIQCRFDLLSFQDWFVPSPALPIPEEGLALNKDQIRETLNYFRKYTTNRIFITFSWKSRLQMSKAHLHYFGMAHRRCVGCAVCYRNRNRAIKMVIEHFIARLTIDTHKRERIHF